jgi:magnesium transporter
MAFFVICVRITILQMSKVDPASLSKLDRRSTMLLQAARQQTELVHEENIAAAEDPGMDTLRGSFSAIGSIIRARSARRLSRSSWVCALLVRLTSRE